MFIKPRCNGYTQCIFGGFYHPHIRNMEVIINQHQHHRWKTTEWDQHDYQSRLHELIGVGRSWKVYFQGTLWLVGSDCLWWGWLKFLLNATTNVSGQWFLAWRHSELYTTLSMSGMWMNLMFSRGMDVMLKYRTVPEIINYSFSKRTMKVANSRFLVICKSAGGWWCSKLDIYTKDSHRQGSMLGQWWWSFWESSTLAIMKAVHPLMGGEDMERTMLCQLSARWAERACQSLRCRLPRSAICRLTSVWKSG